MYIKQCSNRTLQTIYLSHKYDFYYSCRVATLAQTGYACLSMLRYKDGLLSKWSYAANPASWSHTLLPKCSSPIYSSKGFSPYLWVKVSLNLNWIIIHVDFQMPPFQSNSILLKFVDRSSSLETDANLPSCPSEEGKKAQGGSSFLNINSQNCSSQPSMVHWLSSPVFPCSVVWLVVRLFVPLWWHRTKSHFFMPQTPQTLTFSEILS